MIREEEMPPIILDHRNSLVSKHKALRLVLKQFTDKQVPTLVTTDVATRGSILDIHDIKHVIIYSCLNNLED